MTTASPQAPVSVEQKIKMSNLRNEIYKNPGADWTVEKMRSELFMSRYHFERLYKTYFNISCMNDVINARIMQAQKLLHSTDFSIGEIACKCGYKSTEHFSRQFKKNVGVSPKEYKKKF